MRVGSWRRPESGLLEVDGLAEALRALAALETPTGAEEFWVAPGRLEADALAAIVRELTPEPPPQTALSPGSSKPSAVVGALLAIADDELPVLRVHKVATHFHGPPPT